MDDVQHDQSDDRPQGRITRLRSALRERAHDRVEAVRTASAAMRTAADDGPRRGTRRRSAGLAGAGLAALAAMFTLVGQNALAVNFTAAGTSYKVYTDRVSGVDAAGYLNAQPVSGGSRAVAQIGFDTATLNGLCAIAYQSLPAGIGTVSLIIRAGEPVDGRVTAPAGQTISAKELYLATPRLTGRGDEVAKLTLGQSADTLMMGSRPFAGSAGQFGLQAKTLNVSDLDADSYGIDLQGEINLPNLKIEVVPGTKTKADCG